MLDFKSALMAAATAAAAAALMAAGNFLLNLHDCTSNEQRNKKQTRPRDIQSIRPL